MRLKRAKLSLALWAVLIPSALAPLSAHAQTGDAALNAANADLAPVGTVDPAAAAGQPVQPQAQAPVPAAAAVPSGQPETGGAGTDGSYSGFEVNKTARLEDMGKGMRVQRSEERRVGEKWVCRCRDRGSRQH